MRLLSPACLRLLSHHRTGTALVVLLIRTNALAQTITPPITPIGHYVGSVDNLTLHVGGTISLDITPTAGSYTVKLHTEIVTINDADLPAVTINGQNLTAIGNLSTSLGSNYTCALHALFQTGHTTNVRSIAGRFRITPTPTRRVFVQPFSMHIQEYAFTATIVN